MYQHKSIKFKMSEKADAIFIIFVAEESEEESSSKSELT